MPESSVIWVSRFFRTQHTFGTDERVEFLLGHHAKRQGCLTQRRSLAMGLLGDAGRLVVADTRRQSGHQHERRVEVLLDAGEVRLDTHGAILAEAVATVGEKTRALQEAMGDERLVRVQLEMTPGAADVDRD